MPGATIRLLAGSGSDFWAYLGCRGCWYLDYLAGPTLPAVRLRPRLMGRSRMAARTRSQVQQRGLLLARGNLLLAQGNLLLHQLVRPRPRTILPVLAVTLV